MKRKVLILPSWYPSYAGAPAGSFIQSQAEALSKFHGVRVFDCTCRTGLIPKWLWMRLKIRELSRWIQKQGFRPDLIHAHALYPAGVIGLVVGKRLDVPVILTEHTGPLELLFPYFGSQADISRRFQQFSRVIAVSHSLRERILKISPAIDIAVIGNVVRQPFFELPLDISIPQNAGVFVGGLTEAKGAVELLQVIDILERQKTAIELHVLGQGALESRFRQLAEKNKYVKIHVEPPSVTSVQDLLRKASFLILPSRYETFSLVAAEALALGRSVVGFDCGGPRDFVTDLDGYLFMPRDCASLARGIAEIASSAKWKLTLEMAQERRDRIRSSFDAEAIRKRLSSLYESVLDAASRYVE